MPARFVNKNKLKGRQLAAVALLVAGFSQKTAAKKLGINESTLSRWVTNDHVFSYELERRQRAMFENDLRRVAAYRSLPLQKLRSLLNSLDEQVALGAAKELLKVGGYSTGEVTVNVNEIPIMSAQEIRSEIQRIKKDLAALPEPPIEARDAEARLIEAPAGEAAPGDTSQGEAMNNGDQRN